MGRHFFEFFNQVSSGSVLHQIVPTRSFVELVNQESSSRRILDPFICCFVGYEFCVVSRTM